MLVLSPHWPRWIHASVLKHFSTIVNVDICKPATNFFAEGFERDTVGLRDWIECRVDGPYINEITHGSWMIDVEVNLLICVATDQNVGAYRPQELTGLGASFFIPCIHVMKYGDCCDDNPAEELGCLHLKPKSDREKLAINNFGKVRVDTRFTQSSVEGHYTMNLD